MSTSLEADLEKHHRMWWSSRPLKRSLKVENATDFWKYVFEKGGPYKSVPFESYDFYHDCIIRHCNKQSAAIIDEKEWSYDAIHELVNSQLPVWKNSGLNTGKTVAIVLPQGINFVVALMTALHLGLSIVILPLEDPFYSDKRVKRELEQLNPDFVVTLPTHQKLWDQILVWELLQTQPKNLSDSSHTYIPGDQAFIGLETNEAFLCPLRDGLLTLPLKTGTLWAKPLSSMKHDEPFATLAALFAGSTIYHVNENELIDHPELLKNKEIEVLGVSSRLEKLWSKHPGAPHKKLSFWYKSPLLANLLDWDHFTEQNNLKKIPHSDLHIQPERGGMTLASQPKPYVAPTFLQPSLGIPWKLLELNGSWEETWEGVGYYSLDPRLILGETQGSFVISKTMQPARDGNFYPIQEVERAVQSLEFVMDCMIIDDRNSKDLVGSRTTLLTFVLPDAAIEKRDDWENSTRLTIKNEVGEAFIPDRFQFYPLYPQRKDGSLNRNWVLGQHQSGLLANKIKNPVNAQLNRLRQTLYHKLQCL